MTEHPYTPELAASILAQIAEGKSLRSICATEGMPSDRAVRRWRLDHEDFNQAYADARADAADFYAEEIIDVANSAGDPNDKRVKIDALKWCASKLKPKAYGERITHDGAIGGTVLHVIAAAPQVSAQDWAKLNNPSVVAHQGNGNGNGNGSHA